MLMKPIGRRHEQTSRTPVDTDARLPFFPEKRIAFSGQNHDGRAGSVAVGLRVSPRRVLLEMGAHGVGGKMQPNSCGALTSETAVAQFEVPDIWNKIGFPSSVAGDLPTVAVVIALFAAESIHKRKLIVEDKVQIAEAVDHLRRISQRNIACRLASRNIEVLVPRVERRREEASLLPLEGLLLSSFVPHRGCSAAFENIDQLLKYITLRFALPSGRDLTDIGTARATGSDQLNKGTEDAGTPPKRHGNR